MKLLPALTLAATLAAALFPAAGAWAEPACTKRADVMEQLSSKYSEAPVAMGLASGGGVVELTRSDDGKTWTILVTLPNGVACVVAAGQFWEDVPPVPTGPKA
jgi:hypothetical protein